MENKCPCLRCKDDSDNKIYYCMDNQCSSKHKLLACSVINMTPECHFLNTCEKRTEACNKATWNHPPICDEYKSTPRYYRDLEKEDDYKNGRRPKLSCYGNKHVTGKVVAVTLEPIEKEMCKVVMRLDTYKVVTIHSYSTNAALAFCRRVLNNCIWFEEYLNSRKYIVYVINDDTKTFEPII